MNQSKIINNARRQDEEKVGFSLKIPKSLKEQLQALAESESVSMNALIVATLESLINDDCGKELSRAKKIITICREDIKKEIDTLEENGVFTDKDELYHNEQKSFLKAMNEFLGD